MLPSRFVKTIQGHHVVAAALVAYFLAALVVFWPGFYSEGVLKYIFTFENSPNDSCLNDWRGFFYPCLLKILYQKDILLGYFFVFQTLFIGIVIIGTVWQMQKLSPWGAFISLFLFLLLPINFKMQAYLDRNVAYSWLIWAGSLCLLIVALESKTKKKNFFLLVLTFAMFLGAALIRREGYIILAFFLIQLVWSFKSMRLKILLPCLVAVSFFGGAIQDKWPSLALSDNYSLNTSINTYRLLVQNTKPQLTEQEKSVVSAILPDEPSPHLQNNFKSYQISWPSLKPDLNSSKVQPFQLLVLKLCLNNVISCAKIKTHIFYKFLANSPLFDPADNRQNFRFEHSEAVLQTVRAVSQSHRARMGHLDRGVMENLYTSQTVWPSLVSFWGAIGVFFLSLIGILTTRTWKAFWPIYTQFFAVYLFGSLGQMKYLYLIHIYFIAVAPSVLLILFQTIKDRILNKTFPKKKKV